VVVELEDLTLLRSWLIGQLINLHKRVTAQGGTMRIAGLSDDNQEVLRMCRLEDRFPQYPSRANAVMGWRPMKAR
jgi:anti-anti-sigma factor